MNENIEPLSSSTRTKSSGVVQLSGGFVGLGGGNGCGGGDGGGHGHRFLMQCSGCRPESPPLARPPP